MMLDIEKEKIQMKKNGKVVECNILFTFDCESTKKTYVGYTDNSVGSNGRKNIYISSYNPFGMKLELEDITNQNELDMVNEVLMKIDQES